MPGVYVTKEEAKKLYEGKFFYKILKGDDHLRLYGPFDNIYYVTEKAKAGIEVSLTGYSLKNYSFVQVIDGSICEAFEENKILVTDRIL